MSHFSYLFINRQTLGLLLCFAIVDNAPVNKGGQISLPEPTLNSFQQTSRSGLAGSYAYGHSSFSFWRTFVLFSVALVPFLYSGQQYTRIPISPHPGSRLFSGFLIVACRYFPLGGHSSTLSTLTWPNSRCKPRARVTSALGPAAGLFRTLNVRRHCFFASGLQHFPRVCPLTAHLAPGARASRVGEGRGN